MILGGSVLNSMLEKCAPPKSPLPGAGESVTYRHITSICLQRVAVTKCSCRGPYDQRRKTG